MSAINIIKHRDSVHMLTDGAAYGLDGNALFEGPKAFSLPNLPAVIAVRGPASLTPLLVPMISAKGVKSYDDLAAEAAAIAKETQHAFFSLLSVCQFGADFDFVFAGIKASGEPHAGIVCSHDRHGIEPWQVTELGECSMLPGDAAIHAAFAERYSHIASGDELDPARDGLAILEIQRACSVNVPGAADDFAIVGGFAQLTSVYPDRIETRCLKRWTSERLAESREVARA